MKIGNQCVPREAYGGWCDQEHEPVRGAEDEIVWLRNVSISIPGGPHSICVCQRCGCLYLREDSD
jgi:hypothetical protein